MTLAAIPAIVDDLGGWAAAIGAFVGATLLVAGLFARIVKGVVAREVAPIADQLRPNGGKTLRDRVDIIEQNQEHFQARTSAQLSLIRGMVEGLGHRFDDGPNG